jgi:transcriptional regulator with PAS, ATPase and Fis domain
MEQDIRTLEFYLKHEEEIRLEKDKFLSGEAIDLSIIPRHIHESWLRSKSYGVNPYVAVSEGEHKVVLHNAEQFLEKFSNQYEPIQVNLRHFERLFGIKILFTGMNGYPLLGSNQKADKLFLPAQEEVIGTTSATIARIERKICGCFGYQNYKTQFCRQFCVSAPILLDDKKSMVGVVTLMLCPEKTEEQNALVLPLIELLTTTYRLLYTHRTEDEYTTDLFMSALPELANGIVLVNRDGQIKAKNHLAELLLKIDKKNQSKKIVELLENRSKMSDTNLSAVFEYETPQVDISNVSNHSATLYIINPHKNKKHIDVNINQNANYTFKDLLGDDPGFLRAKNEAFVVAPTNASVLIYGETGSGKELFAQSIHNGSLRREAPFVAINCGAISENLIESELFGYEPGSFTGASAKGKIGVLEAASGGTLFLDEVESMPMYVQVRLLRVLSIGLITRVGGIKEIPVDVRVISATKSDLLKTGTRWDFREDLYFRLSTCRIHIPPLRERRHDIFVLAKHFIEKNGKELGYSGITVTDSFMESLYYYDWKGNVRELENAIERALIFMNPEKKILDRMLLDSKMLEISDQNRREALRVDTVKDMNAGFNLIKQNEEQIIQKQLVEMGYNVKMTAQCLGISYQTLYRKIQSSLLLRETMRRRKNMKKTL